MQETTVTELEQIIENTVDVMRNLSKDENYILFGAALMCQSMNMVTRTENHMTRISEVS